MVPPHVNINPRSCGIIGYELYDNLDGSALPFIQVNGTNITILANEDASLIEQSPFTVIIKTVLRDG